MKKVTITNCQGVCGKSLYINDTRVLGKKPYGGGEVLNTWDVDYESFLESIGDIKYKIAFDVLRDYQSYGKLPLSLLEFEIYLKTHVFKVETAPEELEEAQKQQPTPAGSH